jgi:Tol biopolymer transport system component
MSLGVLALASGCHASLVEPLKLGTRLTPDGDTVTAVAWSADGSEIYYLAVSSTGAGALKAAKTDASGVRVIDDTKAEYWSLLTPPDGSSLYYTAVETPAGKGPSPRFLYEALQPRRLDGLTLEQKADVLAAAPDDHHIAVWSAGVLHDYDLTDGSATDLTNGMPFISQTAGNSWEITFSPAGDKLFFLETGGPGTLSGAIVDPATKTVDVHALASTNFPLPNWSDQGLRVLSGTVSVPSTLQIEDVGTGRVSPLSWQAPHSAGGGAWSRDGTLIAALDSWCTSGSLLSCNEGESALYVVEVASGRATLVARSTAGIGLAVFSPDGHRITYTVGPELYVSPVS